MTHAVDRSPSASGGVGNGRGVTSPAVWEVLRTLGRRPSASITDLAAEVGLHKSSVSRLLGGLREEGIVEWDEQSSRYRLGLGLLALAAPLLAEADVVVAARPELELLTRETQESSSLLVWNRSGTICVEQVVSPQPVKHSCFLGESFHSLESASIQVFLAHFEPRNTREILRGGALVSAVGEPDGSPGTVDPGDVDGSEDNGDVLAGAYGRRLADVRRRGWAVNDSETSEQETSVAAPVWDSRGVCAVLLVSAPSYRSSREVYEAHARLVVSAAERVTSKMGGVSKRPPSGSSGLGSADDAAQEAERASDTPEGRA